MEGHFNLGLASLGGKYAAKKKKEKVWSTVHATQNCKTYEIIKAKFLEQMGKQRPRAGGSKSVVKDTKHVDGQLGNGPSLGLLIPTCCPWPPSGTKGPGVRQKGDNKFPLTQLQDLESPWP